MAGARARPSGALLASEPLRCGRLRERLDGANNEYRRAAGSRASAAGRHPAGRTGARRHRSPAAGRGRVRDGRAHPPDLDRVSPGRRRGGAARARGDPQQPLARAHDRGGARVQLLFAPGQYRRGPAQHPLHAGADPGRRGAVPGDHPGRARAAARGRRAAGQVAGLVRFDPGEPGAHRASHRGAAKKRARPREWRWRSSSPSATACFSPRRKPAPPTPRCRARS